MGAAIKKKEGAPLRVGRWDPGEQEDVSNSVEDAGCPDAPDFRMLSGESWFPFLSWRSLGFGCGP